MQWVGLMPVLDPGAYELLFKRCFYVDRIDTRKTKDITAACDPTALGGKAMGEARFTTG